VSGDRSAGRKAELLVPFELDLRAPGVLKGVIFRRNWIETGDFIEVYGVPGTEPPPAIEPFGAHMLSGTGNPACCPRCHGWMNLQPLEVPERYGARSIWHDYMRKIGAETPMTILVCGSCHACFGSAASERYWARNDNPFVTEEYLGQYEEFKYEPHKW
jgi:hypothetical protein